MVRGEVEVLNESAGKQSLLQHMFDTEKYLTELDPHQSHKASFWVVGWRVAMATDSTACIVW